MLIQRYPLLAILVALLIPACAGPNYYFDKGPSPEWTRDSTSTIGQKGIRMIGTAPVTSQTQRDLDFAVRDAKARIGQLFISEVKSRTTDWSLSLQGGNRDGERQVLNQNIEVRTQMKVEDVKVEISYRDKETRTQYVAVTVNRKAWSSKIQKRITSKLGDLAEALSSAKVHRDKRQGLAAYTKLQEGYAMGASIQSDIIVIDLLEPKLGLGGKLATLKNELDNVNRSLRESFSFQLKIKSRAPAIGADFNAKLEEFLNGYGFSLGAQKTPNVILITAEIQQKFVTKENVGNRVEFVHAAQGKLRVTDADGSEVRSLSISLPKSSYTERGPNRKAAARKALELAGDSLSSKFRSQFRKTFQPVAD